jgi:hypothetical protein
MLAAPSKEQQRLMRMAFAEAADVEDEFLQEKQQVWFQGLGFRLQALGFKLC